MNNAKNTYGRSYDKRLSFEFAQNDVTQSGVKVLSRLKNYTLNYLKQFFLFK